MSYPRVRSDRINVAPDSSVDGQCPSPWPVACEAAHHVVDCPTRPGMTCRGDQEPADSRAVAPTARRPADAPTRSTPGCGAAARPVLAGRTPATGLRAEAGQ